MTEEEIQQELRELNESGSFQRRQRLLKELWKMRRREQASTESAERRQSSSQSKKPAAFDEADALVA